MPPIRLVVVDSYPLMPELVKMCLHRVDDVVLVGSFLSGDDLLESIASLLPDVILLDYSPGYTPDLKLIPALRGDVPGVKFIATSFSDSLAARTIALAAGADAAMAKSDLPKRLVPTLRHLVHGSPFTPDQESG